MEKLMTFAQIMPLLLAGNRCARKGWNGTGQWVCHMPAVVIADGLVNGRTRKFVPTGDLNVGAYFVIKTAQGVWQPGWLASQGDLCAEDWYNLDDAAVSTPIDNA